MQIPSQSLRIEQELHKFLAFDPRKPTGHRQCDFLCDPISKFASRQLSSFRPETSLSIAFQTLTESAQEIALVQGSRSRLDGIIELSVIEENLQSRSHFESLTVSHLMDRHISIEPHMTSLREVILRVTVGACKCVVVVDQTGLPVSIVTPRQLYKLLRENSGAISG